MASLASSSTSSSISSINTWEQLRIKIKELRFLLLSSSPEIKIRCEVKKLLAATISYYENPHRYENNSTILDIMSGRNLSPLEASFMWMGAWRPSAAVSLVVSVMGLKEQESQIDIPGTSETTRPALSREELSQLHGYRDLASQAEQDLSEELSTVQMMLADQDVVTDLLEEVDDGSSSPSPKLKAHLDAKICNLRDMLRRADQLRIKTLLELHSLLDPVQAAQCSIAAFEAAFAMRSLDTATPW